MHNIYLYENSELSGYNTFDTFSSALYYFQRLCEEYMDSFEFYGIQFPLVKNENVLNYFKIIIGNIEIIINNLNNSQKTKVELMYNTILCPQFGLSHIQHNQLNESRTYIHRRYSV